MRLSCWDTRESHDHEWEFAFMCEDVLYLKKADAIASG